MLLSLQELVRAALEHTSQKTFKHAFLKEGAEKGVEASPHFALTWGSHAADCLGCVHRGGGTLSPSGFHALCMGCGFVSPYGFESWRAHYAWTTAPETLLGEDWHMKLL